MRLIVSNQTRVLHHLVRKAKRLRKANPNVLTEEGYKEILYQTVRVLFVAKLCKQIFK
jgi:hypothetical protein